MKNIVILACLLWSGSVCAQTHSNELAASIGLTSLKKDATYDLLYRRALSNNKHWRLGGGLNITTDKEIRSDSVSLRAGNVSYTLSTGIQKDLLLDGVDALKAYVAVDGYWNSDFKKAAYEKFYGYYWNFGLRPLFGISYQPVENIRLSLESRGDFNVNLQQYEGKDINRDTRLRFNTFDVLVLNLGYLF